MPYYIFKVRQDKSAATLLESFEQFRDASVRAKALRHDLATSENAYIKVVHAADALEGEQLVLAHRVPSSPVEEWEV